MLRFVFVTAHTASVTGSGDGSTQKNERFLVRLLISVEYCSGEIS